MYFFDRNVEFGNLNKTTIIQKRFVFRYCREKFVFGTKIYRKEDSVTSLAIYRLRKRVEQDTNICICSIRSTRYFERAERAVLYLLYSNITKSRESSTLSAFFMFGRESEEQKESSLVYRFSITQLFYKLCSTYLLSYSLL